ncbi:putative ATP-dependent endonuclease [Rhodovulum sp. PH10]|uniref:ATP-dependent nuclease n=1 Tax=Rhodovulum sp. PH10 TaxID=1187851 RepID=UPI00027C23CF|nr:AAA family ATPase [Rhodovulum sp. PH10]EJW10846.1 putative ATP-dependent endonuclease [Rhodovulum sp. PH10]
MYIRSVTISGFRSFGPTPHKIKFSDGLTAVIGPNASGKTALLQALCKLFGISRGQRNVQRSDFHLPVGVGPDDRTARSLTIEVIIALSELAKGSATSKTVAPCFKHMQIAKTGATPVCRLRLEAQWADDGTAEGEVTQDLFWITTLDDAIKDEHKSKVAPFERGFIQVYYTPATRNPEAQIKLSTGALAARLLRAIEWSKGTRKSVEDATKALSDAFGGESAIKAMSEALSTRWRDLHDSVTDKDPGLALMSQRFEEVVAKVQVLFEQQATGVERGLDVLSDGQLSLFYFALAAAVFDLERAAVDGTISGFRPDALRIPALSVFAIEEPENHLSPYYLSRIVQQVRSIITGHAAQALVTSHSPAVLSRVEPTEVRYCRCDVTSRETSVTAIKLPEDDEEAGKFVRGAMLAFPELYFARYVILVEGDSERVVIPRLAQAEGLLVDPSFVAIVPLGGRHVRYFWDLLEGLDIPYATLLDFDLGRNGGGWGRIKTTLVELIENGYSREQLLKCQNGTLVDLKTMHTWPTNEYLASWVTFLREYDVFFSDPLDLDMAMLKAVPAAYNAIIPKDGGPSGKTETADTAVLGNGGEGIEPYKKYYPGYAELMPEYRYHFLTHSKPATHLRAFTHLDDAALKKNMPEPYRALLKDVKEHLRRD